MPKTYSKAPPEIMEMANAVLCRHESHKPLLDMRVKIEILMVYPPVNPDTGEYDDVPVIKAHGWPAQAIIKILSLKDRAAGRGDAEMLIDARNWDKLTEKEAEALLDHELHHLAVKTNDGGVPLKDDLNRPLLRMRQHTVQFGWFDVVALRNGEHSIEQKQARQLKGLYQQAFWPELERHE